MPVIPKILFANQDPAKNGDCLQILKQYVGEEDIFTCSDSAAIPSIIAENDVNILFLDLTIYQHDSIERLDSIQSEFPELLIIAAIPENARLLEQQILDRKTFFYVTTPYQNSDIQLAIKRGLAKVGASTTNAVTEKRERLPAFYGIIGETAVMQNLFDLISKVSEDDFATVLIRGESGTGKELVAKAIHRHSSRKNNNFVPVNCAAIPDDLLESELFGYTKGAFTGATKNKTGRIEYADRGTLFLDEIGDMKPTLQAKLLRVLQEREFEPVGGLKATPIDTRIVAATHCDLEQLVEEGTFREDLYYRLSVIPIHIPPLKDRKADIPILLDAFLEMHATKRGREKFTLSLDAMAALLTYNWKGNVRELENLVQQMAILCSGKEIHLEDLPERLIADFNPAVIDYEYVNKILLVSETSPAETTIISNDLPPSRTTLPSQSEWNKGQVDFKELINDYESQLIIKAMKLTAGNKKEAAKLLNLKRTTLLEKIKKKNLQGMWEES